MKDKIYLFPVFIRIWHAINAIVIILLIITGISIQYALEGIMSFKSAIEIHNIFGLILIFNYLFFIIGNLISSNGKHYSLIWKNFSKELMQQAKYYVIEMFKHKITPFPINESRKFNPLQKLAYTATMYVLIPLLIFTGLGLMFPEIVIIRSVFNLATLFIADLIHIGSAFFVSVFLIVHLYLCTLGIRKHNTFKSIINGWHYID